MDETDITTEDLFRKSLEHRPFDPLGLHERLYTDVLRVTSLL